MTLAHARDAATRAELDALWAVLAGVVDPEIPVLNVVELGVVRNLSVHDGEVRVALAPTYSGCPAMEAIEHDVAAALGRHCAARVVVERVLSPPWTTDWISDAGRQKLLAYGIAPPAGRGARRSGAPAACPRCRSTDTARTSEFGSTACKAAWRCNACREPFEYFKCI